jgi:hypothetical protein
MRNCPVFTPLQHRSEHVLRDEYPNPRVFDSWKICASSANFELYRVRNNEISKFDFGIPIFLSPRARCASVARSNFTTGTTGTFATIGTNASMLALLNGEALKPERAKLCA